MLRQARGEVSVSLNPPCVPAGPQPLFPVSSPLPGNATFLGWVEVVWGESGSWGPLPLAPLLPREGRGMGRGICQ